MRIAICDDERKSLEDLAGRIKKMLPDCETAAFSSGEELLKQSEFYDIYFLNIQMKDMDGITLARKLRKQNADSVILFISGEKEYVVDTVKKRQLFVTVKGKHITLNAEDIIYFENDKRKIIAHTKEEVVTFYGVMKDLEKKLGEDFYRCHRGYLINLSYVSEYTNDSITFVNGDVVYLSKERYTDFVKQYMRFVKTK